MRSRCDKFHNCYQLWQGSGESAQLALIGGSQPRELFKEVLSEEDKLVATKIKPAFKAFMRENPRITFADRSFEHFKNTLMPDFKAFAEFSDHEKVLTHEYYLSRLRQREQEKQNKAKKIRDEVQYRLKKKMWAQVEGCAEFELKP